jgi:large subunit ribosomal protein L32
MSVRMRHTRAHTGKRRSHHALTLPALTTCVSCGVPALRHRACLSCGKYRGRVVLDVTKKARKAIKRFEATQSKKDGEQEKKKSIPEKAQEEEASV